MVIVGFIAPKMASYMSVAANRCHFKNNHYTPPEERYKQIHRRQLTMPGKTNLQKHSKNRMNKGNR
jgi:hypothetical protein